MYAYQGGWHGQHVQQMQAYAHASQWPGREWNWVAPQTSPVQLMVAPQTSPVQLMVAPQPSSVQPMAQASGGYRETLYSTVHSPRAEAQDASPAGPRRVTPTNQKMPAEPPGAGGSLERAKYAVTHAQLETPVSCYTGYTVTGWVNGNYTVHRDGWCWKLAVQQKGDLTMPGTVTYLHVASTHECVCVLACNCSPRH
jgi:hypothetical protein